MPDSNPPLANAPLFFLDYDGTLAPIVDDPAEAYPHPEVPGLLRELASRHPVWIVTGRHLRDLPSFLNLSLNAIGLHGAQHGKIGEEPNSLMSDKTEEALKRLRANVPELDGIRIEDKGKTFAVHYRGAKDAEETRARLDEWASNLPDGLEAIWGKSVVELRATGLDKGAAVTEVADEHPGRTPVYLGDDVTDEDAFRALADREAITIKVGNGETNANYQFDGVENVVAYLKRYVNQIENSRSDG